MSTEKKLTACSLKFKLYFQSQSDEEHLRGDISPKTTPEKRQKNIQNLVATVKASSG